MQPRQILLATLILSTALGLAGCGSTWVDADPTGCSAQDVQEMNKDGPHGMAEMMGTGFCKAHGMDKFAGKWRCKDHTLQVACK